MTTANFVEKVKDAMRIRHDSLDAILADDIEAGALELKRAGVLAYNDSDELSDDELVLTAIRYYVMATEDYAGKASQYMQSFERLRDALSQSADYILTEDSDEE